MNKQIQAVEKHRELILHTMEHIWKNPEPGYREVKTSAYLEAEYEKLGYTLIKAGDIPGFYTVLDTGREGPEVLVLGELDSLICPEHPASDPQTGAVHSCGHHAQCAALLGLAAALKEPGILDGLSGRIRLCAVPAEELIEIEFRQQLKAKGIIGYMGGKTEFLSRGYFDGVDVAFMVHAAQERCFATELGSVGCIAKNVTYKGVSAHAGGAPWDGVNALYAASQGLSAINAIRETFQEKDIVRVHPILTAGGDAVNAIPERAVLESYVRGENFEGIQSANQKVNRALCGAALSLGANIEIRDTFGYGPLKNSPDMITLAGDAAAFLPEVPYKHSAILCSGSTDMGDLSCVMPVVHCDIGGAVGKNHGIDFYIDDPELAGVTSAKWQLIMLTLLLQDGGARAKQIKENFKPRFASKEEYFAYVDGFASEGDRISYREDGVAEIKL